jgi:glycosyltransferase involved in cell wall biosynthesis
MRKRIPNNLTKRILLVGMFDSVHFARWITQFHQENVEITIFPSRKFRKVHPLVLEALKTNEFCSLGSHRLKKFLPGNLYGYIDYFLFILPFKAGIRFNIRGWFLKKVIQKSDVDYVHLLEFQHAGYLYLDAIKSFSNRPNYKLISTNWGSDIYYFQHDPIHKSRIQELLALTDLYSAECTRDYDLARNLGYSGKFLPCIPNAGGFRKNSTETPTPDVRSGIVCKAYGGQFGRGDLLLAVLDEFLALEPNIPVFLYSVTEDLLDSVNELVSKFPNVKFSEQRNKLSHKELLMIFRSARIYIGLSRSDGISTSFLEALTTGTYPIQSDTSCAQEWVAKGVIASIVPLKKEEILRELTESYFNLDKLSLAQIKNSTVSDEFLDYDRIAEVGRTFYS